MLLFGLDLRYLMVFCLGLNLIADIITLKGYSVITLVPLGAALLYHYLHNTLNTAAIALVLPFIFYCVKFVKRQIPFYDLVKLSTVGAIMGWPFSLETIIVSKILYWFLGIIGIIRLLSRNKGGGYYAFPYMGMIVIGAAEAYYLFREFPQVERMLFSLYP